MFNRRILIAVIARVFILLQDQVVAKGKCECEEYYREWYLVVVSCVTGTTIICLIVLVVRCFCQRCVRRRAPNSESRGEPALQSSNLDPTTAYESVDCLNPNFEATGSFAQTITPDQFERNGNSGSQTGESSTQYHIDKEQIYSSCGEVRLDEKNLSVEVGRSSKKLGEVSASGYREPNLERGEIGEKYPGPSIIEHAYSECLGNEDSEIKIQSQQSEVVLAPAASRKGGTNTAGKTQQPKTLPEHETGPKLHSNNTPTNFAKHSSKKTKPFHLGSKKKRMQSTPEVTTPSKPPRTDLQPRAEIKTSPSKKSVAVSKQQILKLPLMRTGKITTELGKGVNKVEPTVTALKPEFSPLSDDSAGRIREETSFNIPELDTEFFKPIDITQKQPSKSPRELLRAEDNRKKGYTIPEIEKEFLEDGVEVDESRKQGAAKSDSRDLCEKDYEIPEIDKAFLHCAAGEKDEKCESAKAPLTKQPSSKVIASASSSPGTLPSTAPVLDQTTVEQSIVPTSTSKDVPFKVPPLQPKPAKTQRADVSPEGLPPLSKRLKKSPATKSLLLPATNLPLVSSKTRAASMVSPRTMFPAESALPNPDVEIAELHAPSRLQSVFSQTNIESTVVPKNMPLPVTDTNTEELYIKLVNQAKVVPSEATSTPTFYTELNELDRERDDTKLYEHLVAEQK